MANGVYWLFDIWAEVVLLFSQTHVLPLLYYWQFSLFTECVMPRRGYLSLFDINHISTCTLQWWWMGETFWHIHIYTCMCVYREYISSLNFKTNTFVYLLDSKKIGSRDILYMLHRLCSSAAKILTCASFTQWQIFQICKQIYPFFSTLHVYDPNFKSWCLTLCKLLTFQYW